MRLVLYLHLILIVAAGGSASAATFVVGDNLGGWRVPSGGAADYANWASGHVFTVGDVLGILLLLMAGIVGGEYLVL